MDWTCLNNPGHSVFGQHTNILVSQYVLNSGNICLALSLPAASGCNASTLPRPPTWRSGTRIAARRTTPSNSGTGSCTSALRVPGWSMTGISPTTPWPARTTVSTPYRTRIPSLTAPRVSHASSLQGVVGYEPRQFRCWLCPFRTYFHCRRATMMLYLEKAQCNDAIFSLSNQLFPHRKSHFKKGEVE